MKSKQLVNIKQNLEIIRLNTIESTATRKKRTINDANIENPKTKTNKTVLDTKSQKNYPENKGHVQTHTHAHKDTYKHT